MTTLAHRVSGLLLCSWSFSRPSAKRIRSENENFQKETINVVHKCIQRVFTASSPAFLDSSSSQTGTPIPLPQPQPCTCSVCPQHSLCHHAQGYAVDSYGSLQSRHSVAHTHEWCSTRRQCYSSLTNTWGHIIRPDHGQCMHNDTKEVPLCVVKMQLTQIQEGTNQCLTTM